MIRKDLSPRCDTISNWLCLRVIQTQEFRFNPFAPLSSRPHQLKRLLRFRFQSFLKASLLLLLFPTDFVYQRHCGDSKWIKSRVVDETLSCFCLRLRHKQSPDSENICHERRVQTKDILQFPFRLWIINFGKARKKFCFECELNPLFPPLSLSRSGRKLFLTFHHRPAILAKVVGKASSASRRDDARYNIVISNVYKNSEGRNPIAVKSKKIQLVVPGTGGNCRCPNLEINRWVASAFSILIAFLKNSHSTDHTWYSASTPSIIAASSRSTTSRLWSSGGKSLKGDWRSSRICAIRRNIINHRTRGEENGENEAGCQVLVKPARHQHTHTHTKQHIGFESLRDNISWSCRRLNVEKV